MHIKLTSKLIETYNLQTAPDGAAYGEIAGIPAVISTIDYEYPAVLIKFSITPATIPETKQKELFKALLALDYINCELIDSAAWLTIYKADQQSEDSITSAIEGFSGILKTQNLQVTPDCRFCRTENQVELFYHNGSLGRICSNCLKEKEAQRKAEEEKAAQCNPFYLLTIPALLLFSSITWALFWELYYWTFSYLQADEIYVPTLVVIIVCALYGAVSAIPLGFCVRKSGLNRLTSNLLASLILTAATFFIGEYINLAYLMFKAYGPWQIFSAIFVYPSYIIEGNQGMWLSKGMLLAAFFVSLDNYLGKARTPESSLFK